MKEKREADRNKRTFIVGMVTGVIFAIPTGFVVVLQLLSKNGGNDLAPGLDEPLWLYTFLLSLFLFLVSIYRYKQSQK
ncbi:MULTISPECIES: hypothetical protein [unclassified Breznakia]|uniref:hypothetical protein n=1 Tax=unclassified Breznakia TaxID=2623764 RepID=UPI002405BB5A|nr:MULTISPECIES: hypothetical protein [unclassified Breznakia]MDF9837056.1 succinate dehydrogenase hydrophobic anchor subunit [Breznakia sp. PFB2-8]MDF9858981.1 succinate dehydrogenase hydrophobic anchor subunit [Breznakia sp. PH5-24]